MAAGTGIKIINKLFPEYYGKNPLGMTDRCIEYPFVIENLPKPPCGILDAGCAGSILPYILKAIGYKVTGIDKRECLFPNFIRGDITESVIPQSFNIVTAVSTIEHIKDDLKAINRIYQVLDFNGWLLMSVPYGEHYKQTQFHKIYDMKTLASLLNGFHWEIKIADSCERKEQIALIKALKWKYS